jgi:hypothetical protein
MFIVLSRLSKLVTSDERYSPALAMMVYLALLGTIERIPTVYSQELFIVFLFIVIFTLSAPHNIGTKESAPDGALEAIASANQQEAV